MVLKSSEKRIDSVTTYSAEIRCDGEVSVPSHRRLSDFVNDNGSAFLIMAPATLATWENGSFARLQQVDSIALLKQNIVAVIPSAGSMPGTQGHPTERTMKVPVRAIIHAPPLLLACDLNFHPLANWLDALTTERADFLAVTNVSTWYFKTHTPLGTDLEFALINRRWIFGLEPKTESTKDI